MDFNFFAEKMDKITMSDYGLDPMQMVKTVVGFVIKHKKDAKAVDDCFMPDYSPSSKRRLNAAIVKELMQIYWNSNNLEDCRAFREFVVMQYWKGKMKNLNVESDKVEKVSDIPFDDVDAIVKDYLTNSGRIHYEKVFTDDSMKGNTAVLVQKLWGENKY